MEMGRGQRVERRDRSSLMPMSLLIPTLATVSGTASGLLPVLQIVKMVRGRAAAGVSLGYIGGNLANALIFCLYGACSAIR